MTKRLLIIFVLLISAYTRVYSSSLLDFTYEYPLLLRVCDICGYDFQEAEANDHVCAHRVRIEDDTCVAILIREANLLKRADPMLSRYCIPAHMQLILVKQGYGYDILTFMGSKDVHAIELNGKLMCESVKWRLFIKELIKYHEKYKKITHEMLKEILRNSGMKM